MCRRIEHLALVLGQLLEGVAQVAGLRSRLVWAWPVSVSRTSSVGTARRARMWSSAALRATRMIQAAKGTSRCSYLLIAVISLAKTFWVMSSASWWSWTKLVT